MSGTTRKQYNFDLDTKALKEFYPGKNWRNAYNEIKRHFIKNGFSWSEGSILVSKEPITFAEANNIIASLVEKYPYLNKCMKDNKLTEVSEKYHDVNYFFDKNTDLQK